MLNNLWDRRSKEKYGVGVRTTDDDSFHDDHIRRRCQGRSYWNSRLWMNVRAANQLITSVAVYGVGFGLRSEFVYGVLFGYSATS
jgi:hypothetical protein